MCLPLRLSHPKSEETPTLNSLKHSLNHLWIHILCSPPSGTAAKTHCPQSPSPKHSCVAPDIQHPKAASAYTVTDLPGHAHLVLSAECDNTVAPDHVTCFVVLRVLITIWNFLKKLALICFPVAAINTMTKSNRKRKGFASVYNLRSIIKKS